MSGVLCTCRQPSSQPGSPPTHPAPGPTLKIQVLQRSGWRVCLLDDSELRAAMGALQRESLFHELIAYVVSYAHHHGQGAPALSPGAAPQQQQGRQQACPGSDASNQSVLDGSYWAQPAAPRSRGGGAHTGQQRGAGMLPLRPSNRR